MACLDMYNSEHKGHHHHCPPMSPRISFSNDFAETQQVMKQERNSREAPVSSDFEFSVSNYSMMSADELFFKGFGCSAVPLYKMFAVQEFSVMFSN
ncbi:hypothetical protein V6Z12_D11G214900 [Gossypium hirsutum]